jgi:PhnB protein
MKPYTKMPLPEGMHNLSPHLVCAGAAEAIEFYKRAFDAVELMRMPGPDGKIMHATISVLGCSVMLVDENLQWGIRGPKLLGGTPVTLHLVVEDADAAAVQAEAAGAKIVMPVTLQFWGDRYGIVEDPYGHKWSLATPSGAVMSSAEMTDAMNAAIRPNATHP